MPRQLPNPPGLHLQSHQQIKPREQRETLHHVLWKKATHNGSKQRGKTALAPNSQRVSQQPRDSHPSVHTEDALLREILGHFPLQLNSLLPKRRQKTPRTQILLNSPNLTRRLPTQAYSNGTTWPTSEHQVSAARTLPQLHTQSLTFLRAFLYFLLFSWAFGKRSHPEDATQQSRNQHTAF